MANDESVQAKAVRAACSILLRDDLVFYAAVKSKVPDLYTSAFTVIATKLREIGFSSAHVLIQGYRTEAFYLPSAMPFALARLQNQTANVDQVRMIDDLVWVELLDSTVFVVFCFSFSVHGAGIIIIFVACTCP